MQQKKQGVGVKELHQHGFQGVMPIKLKNRKITIWFETLEPDTGESVLMLKLPSGWHAFGKKPWTGSGHDPERALRGLIGDVISTDSQLRSYCRIVRKAPDRLTQEYDGLYESQKQCHNQFGNK